MATQTNSSVEVNSVFTQKNSPAIRVWHWLTFILVISLIVTVLLESTTLNQRDNIPVIQNTLKSKGITVDNNQALAVSHIYGEKMWDIHKLLGYALSFLFLSRIVIEFTQSKEERNQTRIKKALFAFLQSKDELTRKELKHYLIVKYSYMLFYGLLLAMVASGLLIAFGADFGISGPTRHNIKEVHAFVQYLIYAFIAFHLIGVIMADMGKYRGMVSGMIHGNK